MKQIDPSEDPGMFGIRIFYHSKPGEIRLYESRALRDEALALLEKIAEWRDDDVAVVPMMRDEQHPGDEEFPIDISDLFPLDFLELKQMVFETKVVHVSDRQLTFGPVPKDLEDTNRVTP